jgi:hypothetical protein
MRTLGILALGSALLGFMISDGQAASWCSGDKCGFQTQKQCARTTGARCSRAAVARRVAPPVIARPATMFPNRPYWASPMECYFDEGYGRFTPCTGGGIAN